MSERVRFANIKQDHNEWVAKIKNFLYNDEHLNLDEVVSDQLSKVGIWFYTIGKDKYGHLEEIQLFEIKHIKLHKLANEIVDLKNTNQKDLAKEYFSDLTDTSDSILLLLTNAEKILNVGLVEEQEFLDNKNVAVVWDKAITLTIEMNRHGKIVFANNNFIEVSGYQDMELIGKPFTDYLSESMPQVITNYMIDVVKNISERPTFLKLASKNGKYYWVYAICKFNFDKNNLVDSFTICMTGTNRSLIEAHIEPLYSQLKQIERKKNVGASTKYLEAHLAMRNRDYDDFIINLLSTNQDTIKSTKTGFGSFFKKLGV